MSVNIQSENKKSEYEISENIIYENITPEDSTMGTKTNVTRVHNIPRFNVKDTFDCGQCFRWIEQPDGSFEGIVGKRVLRVKNIKNGQSQREQQPKQHSEQQTAPKIFDSIEIIGADVNTVQNELAGYFDFATDYNSICERLQSMDEHLKTAIDFAGGIRLLKQPLAETIFSFIISANNNVPRIMGIIDRISMAFGERIDDTHFAFPTIDALAQGSAEDFRKLGAGYRAEYIVKTAEMLKDNNDDELKSFKESLSKMTLEGARKTLLEFQGVGPKVADCIILFSGINCAAFPTDVWVKRIMELLYSCSKGSLKSIMEFAEEYFGDLAGYAQQYLFHYARKNAAKLL